MIFKRFIFPDNGRRFIPFVVFLIGFIICDSGYLMAQKSWEDIPKLLTIPDQYIAVRTTDEINIDGVADERAWESAGWMNFSDIETGALPPADRKSRSKLLWDDDNLYVYAEFIEKDIWGYVTEHDQSVFMDNAFEIFLNPDGSTYNYFEFQINALGTVWDLFLPRPYRTRGKGLTAWDIKGLRKAVKIKGTINDPSDTDTSWSVELAIPLTSLGIRNVSQIGGGVWRMNFSRVEWVTKVTDGKYEKVRNEKNPFGISQYDVWSPVGIVDLHYPERWGYVGFSDSLHSTERIFHKEQIITELKLWKYYYLQQMYRMENGSYASGISILDSIARAKSLNLESNDGEVEMFSDRKQFWLQINLNDGDFLAIDQNGELYNEKKKQ